MCETACVQVCSQTSACYVTYSDPFAPHTPFFWCEPCFKHMHYTAEVSIARLFHPILFE